jgi:hypothetical protein
VFSKTVWACPVALAVRRVVKDKVRIEVRDLSVLIEIPEHLIHIENGMVMNDDVHTLSHDLFMHRTELPAKARAFIDAYDTAEPINELPVRLCLRLHRSSHSHSLLVFLR